MNVSEMNKNIREICIKFGGKYEIYAGTGRCKLPPEHYKRFRQEYPVDFIIESDREGVSLVSKKDSEYFLENWLKPKKPVYGIAGLISLGRDNWELIEFKPINRVERNKLRREADEGRWEYEKPPSRSRLMRDAELLG